MKHTVTIPFVGLLACTGCVQFDSKLGEGAESTDDASDDDVVPSSTADASMSGPGEQVDGAIGAPCDHGAAPDYVPESKLLTYPAPDCAGDVCVYGDIYVAPAEPCTSDDQCNASDPAVMRFVCNDESRCELARPHFLERSMCSAMCEVDADCATDADTTCQTGFSCRPMASVGEACCEPVCVCNDDLDEATAFHLTEACVSGTQQGCCDVLPGNGLCP